MTFGEYTHRVLNYLGRRFDWKLPDLYEIIYTPKMLNHLLWRYERGDQPLVTAKLFSKEFKRFSGLLPVG